MFERDKIKKSKSREKNSDITYNLSSLENINNPHIKENKIKNISIENENNYKKINLYNYQNINKKNKIKVNFDFKPKLIKKNYDKFDKEFDKLKSKRHSPLKKENFYQISSPYISKKIPQLKNNIQNFSCKPEYINSSNKSIINKYEKINTNIYNNYSRGQSPKIPSLINIQKCFYEQPKFYTPNRKNELNLNSICNEKNIFSENNIFKKGRNLTPLRPLNRYYLPKLDSNINKSNDYIRNSSNNKINNKINYLPIKKRPVSSKPLEIKSLKNLNKNFQLKNENHIFHKNKNHYIKSKENVINKSNLVNLSYDFMYNDEEKITGNFYDKNRNNDKTIFLKKKENFIYLYNNEKSDRTKLYNQEEKKVGMRIINFTKKI